MDAPQTSFYNNDSAVTLADVRGHFARHPEAIYQEPCGLARRLKRPVADVEAAYEWLIQDGLEVLA